MKTQRGFTLIELIVVIIILGILSAVAVPKFVDLSVEARNASAKGVAAALSSGSAMNYAARAASAAGNIAVNAANVCTPAILGGLLSGSSVTLSAAAASALTSDDQYAVGNTGDCSTTAASVVCTVTARGTTTVAASAPIVCAR